MCRSPLSLSDCIQLEANLITDNLLLTFIGRPINLWTWLDRLRSSAPLHSKLVVTRKEELTRLGPTTDSEKLGNYPASISFRVPYMTTHTEFSLELRSLVK